MMNLEFFDSFFDNLKTYLNTHYSTWGLTITKMSLKDSDKFPLIVITEENNTLATSDMQMRETISRGAYEINIYTRDKKIGDVKHYAMNEGRILSHAIDYYISKHYRMMRVECRPTPNIDNSIYRITMRYEALINDQRGKQIN